MKTEQLIDLLASGVEPVPAGTTARRYALALACAVPVTLAMMLVLLGLRADLHEAVLLPMFWVKVALPVGLAVCGFVAVIRLARPGVSLGRVPMALAVPVAAIWSLAIYALMAAAPGERTALLLGKTWAVCPFLIAMLSVPGFIAAFWAMRGLAPTRPASAGAAAGLLAGAVATAVYSLHCPEMAAPFLATWYLLGMLIPTAIGAALGPHLLRW